jgi:hypothetical protein
MSPFNIAIGARFLCAFLMVVCFTAVASATLIDFEDLYVYDINDNLAEVDSDYAGLDWTLPNIKAHWKIKNEPGHDWYPFPGSGNSDIWLLGSADDFGIKNQNRAKITQLNNDPFRFISMDLRGRSDKDQWLTEVDVRARDIDGNQVITTVKLTDTWTTYTASDLGFTSLDELKSLTFFGDSGTTGDEDDRFALDNLNVNIHTPEPMTIVLMGVGLLLLGVVIRQRRKDK